MVFGGKASKKGKGVGVKAVKKDAQSDDNKVFVGCLPWKAKWQELKDHMGQAGTVTYVKINTEDGTEFGRSRGTGYVRFESAAEAQNAVAVLNGSELMGRAIQVDSWTGSSGSGLKKAKEEGKGVFGMGGKGAKGAKNGMGGMGGKTGTGGMGGVGMGVAIPDGKGGYWVHVDGGKGRKGGGKTVQVNDHGDPNLMVYVGGLPFAMKWQDLKDLFGKAGTVEFARILTEDGSEYGRSRGMACLRFATAAQAASAIRMFNGTELDGRTIQVDKWGRA